MNVERENRIDFEKEQKLLEIGKEVEKLEDKLGKGIDPGIRETLISVKAYGFPTSGSCEGHNHRGEALPWIEIENPAPVGWEEDEKKKELWRQWNNRDVGKLRKLVEQFYEERKEQGKNISEKVKLDFWPIGKYGAMRLQPSAQTDISGSGKVTEQMGKEREQMDLEPYKKEMVDFGEYLRRKFLEE